ncbi:SMP-30/gluconolactonase/LRE family protein [Rodentibacter pneumotropicus]|uniref:SMP-30/gluconolactonase/LRE family protein n=1 Tax=Rodentibacter pneumotropicus TaxID=758 RepID=A0A4S2PJ60_9PAST|nr:SMP-30/gluconolactonase/LRE family protein [Rodentibacter pneumotropicus]THA01075.1 SMP-30/gluconolactonase/LRE family protein [Rodentibacter pneumotropicus]THA03087.1 SMP-30/gluconolactonase/LRE family protein [Rodentibacter pneumotropicus]THA05340.1 SMP-30/gluconolactonase/LRE family protein [Rodentibacter pneumotropicus]THA15116.1 SMP-30/gluconolactonase/LRE family protein [Rodentibacter pneumotropicus]
MAIFTTEIYDERFYTLVGTKFQLDELFSNAVWAEGPVWLPQQQAVIFSDVKGNTLYRWTKQNGTQVLRSPSYFANGNTLDMEGNLITCEHGRRAISKTDKQGNVQILVDKLEGKRFNSPNDLVVKSDGTIWFTDPPYGILSDAEGKKSPSEIIGCYIYCYDPKTDEINIATFNVMRPNGLAFSSDEKQLFVADMSVVEFEKEGLHHLVVFDVEGKRLKNRRNVAEINPGIPDGLKIDKQGVIYCSCENGIIVLLSDGTYLGRFIVGKTTSNCTFGDNQKTLFVTSSNSLYKLTIE